ncbi:MAG: hypothetical protein IMZ61_13940 [Planctomycetes bacterium]|nr:hypothetical protein [Planctomycetota bacterium]
MPLYCQMLRNKQLKSVRGNLQYRKRILKAGYESEEVAKELWIACKRDPFFWINTFVWTYNPKVIPRETTRPMVTYDFQDNALWKLFSSVVNQLDLHQEKSREMTATWNLLMVFVWFAQFHPGLVFRLVSRNAEAVDSTEDPDSLFPKIDFILEHQPPWMINEGQYNRTNMHFNFYETSSTINGSSTTGDVARGGRPTAIGFDEFAFVPDSYAMLRASQMATNCRIYNSTPNGTGNAFYDLKKAKIQHLRLHWSSHPEKRKGLYRSEGGELKIIDKEFKGIVVNSEGLKFVYPDNYPFRLDGKLRSPFYDRECDRSAHPMEIAQELDIDYLGSNYQFFTSNVIDRIQLEDVREPLIRGELEFDPESYEPLKFVPFPDGRIQLWVNLTPEGLFPDNLSCVLGADVSAGTGASNSALSGVDRETGEKVMEFAECNMLAEDFGTYSVVVAKWLNQAYLIWDASGQSGRIYGNRVMDLKYNYVYWKTALNRITRKPSETPGYYLNPGDKAEAFGRYRRALKDGTFIQRSYEANKECLYYVQIAGGKGIEHTTAIHCQDPTGARENHGDRCVADVMANYGLYVLKDGRIKPIIETIPHFCYASRKQRYETKLREREEVWA